LDVIDGLCYLHRLDVVHGGLDPVRVVLPIVAFTFDRVHSQQNVLISDNGRALITGLEGEASETSSARYLAPESIEEGDMQPTKAADIWSFGCICYEVSLNFLLATCAKIAKGALWERPILPASPSTRSPSGYYEREKANSTWSRRSGWG
jgi:serine/threonine protein kinase